jgi:hypothetical protein
VPRGLFLNAVRRGHASERDKPAWSSLPESISENCSSRAATRPQHIPEVLRWNCLGLQSSPEGISPLPLLCLCPRVWAACPTAPPSLIEAHVIWADTGERDSGPFLALNLPLVDRCVCLKSFWPRPHLQVQYRNIAVVNITNVMDMPRPDWRFCPDRLTSICVSPRQ